MNVGTTAAPPVFGSAAIATSPAEQGRSDKTPDHPAQQPPPEAAKAPTGLIVDRTCNGARIVWRNFARIPRGA